MKITLANRLTVYLLIACVLLAAILLLQRRNLVQADVNGAVKPSSTVELPTKRKFAAPGIAVFSEITERPLFVSSRQPLPKPKPKAVAVVRRSPLNLTLEGVVISETERVAVLVDTTNREILQLAIGMSHKGWELAALTDTVATFKRGEQTQELELKE